MTYLQMWLLESWKMTQEMAPWLLLGFLVSGILHSFLPQGWISKHLSNSGFKGVLKAALVGAPLPLCSCGVIPVTRWLRKEGASRSSSLSFLVATPETGVDSILATLALMGPVFGILRPSLAILSAIAIGILAMRFLGNDDSQMENSEPMPSQLMVRSTTFLAKIRESFSYGFRELFDDVAKWLLIGLLVGGAISAFVPSTLVQSAGNWGLIGSYLAVIALGVPLYVCATGSIPIAAALMAKGISPGAVLVFLLVGPATNVATIAFVKGSFGKKALTLYLTSIIGIAFLAGIILDVFSPHLFTHHSMHQHTMEGTTFLPTLAGIALLLLFIPIAADKIQKIISSFTRKPTMESMTFNIPNMNCQNCARHVDKAARSISGVESITIDIPTRKVQVEGIFDLKALQEKLKEEGYPTV